MLERNIKSYETQLEEVSERKKKMEEVIKQLLLEKELSRINNDLPQQQSIEKNYSEEHIRSRSLNPQFADKRNVALEHDRQHPKREKFITLRNSEDLLLKHEICTRASPIELNHTLNLESRSVDFGRSRRGRSNQKMFENLRNLNLSLPATEILFSSPKNFEQTSSTIFGTAGTPNKQVGDRFLQLKELTSGSNSMKYNVQKSNQNLSASLNFPIQDAFRTQNQSQESFNKLLLDSSYLYGPQSTSNKMAGKTLDSVTITDPLQQNQHFVNLY